MVTLLNMDVKVLRFISNAMHDQMDSGSFEYFDASEVSIIKPDNLRDNKILIYHSKQNIFVEMWKQEGRIIKFEIDEILLNEGYLIFSSGIQNVEFVQE